MCVQSDICTYQKKSITRRYKMKKAEFNVTGSDRKELVLAIAERVGERPIYQGMPTAAYKIGNYTVTKNGVLEWDEKYDLDVELLLEKLIELGYEAELKIIERQENVDGNIESGIAIQMPMMSGDEISRLEQIIASKENLIKKAVGAESLMVGEKDGKLDFSWFSNDAGPDEVKAYMNLVTALCRMAKTSTRVNGSKKPVENEKYAFRCFLLRLGFIGDEYKEARKILLRNFSGSSAFKGGAKNEITK